MESVTKCPKCGFNDRDAFNLCPSCGIVIEKFLKLERERQVVAARFLSIQQILKRYEGRLVSLNLDDPTSYKKVKLVSSGDDCVTFLDERRGLYLHYPFNQVLSVVESADGASLVVSVFHLVVYKGAIGVGFNL